jgi:hypothetical protein
MSMAGCNVLRIHTIFTLCVISSITASLFLGGCDPAISIESVAISGTIMRIGIAPGISGMRCEHCLVFESSRSLNKEFIFDINTQRLISGKSYDGIHAILNSSKRTWIDNVVSSRGVKGMDSFELDISKITINKNMHYYALAMIDESILSYRCIDQYIK